ncbi:MAG: hypothetical protein ACE5F6_04100, partial [Anaerolineae bacterium]
MYDCKQSSQKGKTYDDPIAHGSVDAIVHFLELVHDLIESVILPVKPPVDPAEPAFDLLETLIDLVETPVNLLKTLVNLLE